MPRLSALLLAILVAACGNRGPLVLPPGPPPEPLFGVAKPAPAKPVTPPSGEPDVSTPPTTETR